MNADNADQTVEKWENRNAGFFNLRESAFIRGWFSSCCFIQRLLVRGSYAKFIRQSKPKSES